jgi:hypothetical protein
MAVMHEVHIASGEPHFERHASSSHAHAFVHVMYGPQGPAKVPLL